MEVCLELVQIYDAIIRFSALLIVEEAHFLLKLQHLFLEPLRTLLPQLSLVAFIELREDGNDILPNISGRLTLISE